MEQGKMCACPHHKMAPAMIVLIGLAFLLQTLNYLSAGFVAIAWPVLVILIGLQKMLSGHCKCCSGCGCEGGKCM